MDGGKRRREDQRRNAGKGSDSKACTNCGKACPFNHFSKKQIHQRNSKRLICFTCLGKPIPGAANRAPIKKECQECGKILSSEGFSKAQWGKCGECKRCIERKKKQRVVCTLCNLPNAHAGFTMCRDCYLAQKEDTKSSKLSIGVRYIIPNFRNERDLSFQTCQLPLNTLIGNYTLLYVSLDGDQLQPISSSAKGSLEIKTKDDSENRMVGSVKMALGQLQERFDSISSFDIIEQPPDRGVNTELLAFFASHVHIFAPDSSWHDHQGDCYTLHGDGIPGKLKIIKDDVALPLWYSSSRKIRPQRNADEVLRRYENTSNYWVCNHFRLSEDIGRLIRKFVCPIPVLQFMSGDLFLVTAASAFKRRVLVQSEVIVVARKV
ncbi:unnamed protein product [Cylindrotheca closterium]|uniref:Uncharacterized protein n=1 Tax=Cylindrotheca closterium TaxID=2856 RepID=A0AAD2GB28_9STRA|nr:unnamed protein product [Cylindrotheca closterium]